MNKKKYFKYSFLLLFIIYIFVFFASESGYYEYNIRKKTVLTNEKIKEFENDVKNNKNIELTDYLESTEKNYKNNLTNTCAKVNIKINEYFKNGIEGIFKVLNKLVED